MAPSAQRGFDVRVHPTGYAFKGSQPVARVYPYLLLVAGAALWVLCQTARSPFSRNKCLCFTPILTRKRPLEVRVYPYLLLARRFGLG